MPPGPRLPRIVQTVCLLVARSRFIAACRRRHGDLISFHTLFDSGFVMVFDPAAVREVFQASPGFAQAGRANAGVEPLHGAHSLMALDGAEHRRHRRLVMPALAGERLQAYEAVIVEACDRAIDRWPVGRPFALLPSMYTLTLEVIMRAVFGVEERDFRDELTERVRVLLEPDRFPSRRRFDRRHRAVDELLYAEISRRRGVPDLDRRVDVLSTLLGARDEDGRPLTDEELRDELVALLIAGHETTATSLSWAFELLLRDPQALERLRSSLEAGETDHLDAVVKETLRLRPAASGVGRLVCESPLELGGYLIPPRVEISPSIAGIHGTAELYPEPDAFRPERFLGTAAPDAETWFPFGGGTRRCPGASFASFEMRTVIRRVLERASLEPAARRPESIKQRAVTPPTRAALGRSLRRGRRPLPRRGVRVRQTAPPAPGSVIPLRAETPRAAARPLTRAAE